jgi:hypothetical protein
MNTTALIRPAWTPATIALMVVGFVVFWPLGLAMLAYILWGERLDGFKRTMNGEGWFKGCSSRRTRSFGGFNNTGNVAFDDWRSAELSRLDEERRKLDQARDEFDAYVTELRRAKDQDEFDRFMNSRNGRSQSAGSTEIRDPGV